MNIINLRSVGSYEIPDSFRGILRISPNNLIDDPSNILVDTTAEIYLSDSVGNKLPLTFIPKNFSTTVDNREGIIDLINLTISVDKLFVSNKLNLKQTLYITLDKDTENDTPPIIFSNASNAVGYPFESPDDAAYFNFNSDYNFDKEKSWSENLSLISPDDPVYKNDVDCDNSKHWLSINGQYLYNHIKYNNEYYKVPMLKKRDYTLGVRLKDKYKLSNAKGNSIHNISDLIYQTDGTYTQLSFLPLESIVFSSLEADVRGVYRSPARGRYTNLNVTGQPTEENNTGNNLAKTLFVGKDVDDFDLDALEAELNKKAPIIGVGVQPGTIHYNAIPAHRYFFHLSRYYDEDGLEKHLYNISGTITSANKSLSTSVSNIVKEYVLCDGKNIDTDYPAIDKHSFEKNWSDTHVAIRNSIMGEGASSKSFKTPPLFDCDQLSLRFIRGLNWLRSTKENVSAESIYNTTTSILNDKGQKENSEVYFANNDKKYIKIRENVDDVANHSKNISEVGLHYASIDNALQRNWKHSHLGFGATTNGEVNLNPNVEGDTLKNYRKYFAGYTAGNSDYCPVKDDETDYKPWENYVKSWNISPADLSPANSDAKFAGTTILPTIGGLKLKGVIIDGYKYLRNYPIIRIGGSSSYWWAIDGCLRFGTRNAWKCMNHRTRTHGEAKIRDGKYILASAMPSKSWRFITSLPEVNKYDDIDFTLKNKSRVTYHKSPTNSSGIREIDDNLPSPSAVNFIPLMKI